MVLNAVAKCKTTVNIKDSLGKLVSPKIAFPSSR